MALYVDIEKKLSSFTLKAKFEKKDEVLGFLGESGSGKSMTLRCIAGLEKPTRGKIMLNDRVLFDSEKKINLSTQERNVGFLFQNYALFPHMTVTQNIELGLSHLKKDVRKKISKEYIERLCLNGLQNRYPWQLSGGQQQRVCLARALSTSPEILLLDEPFSALDYHLRSNMEKELMNILKDYNGDIVFVTHDISEAYRVCDDIVVYNNGLAMPKRTIDDLFTHPKSLIEAKITGCKNISTAERLNDNTIYAKDWGYIYKVNDTLEDDIKYVGIRAHHISIEKFDGENTFYFTVTNIIENPFNYTVCVINNAIEKHNSIQIDISKDVRDFEIGDKILIKFEQNNIFTFK
jgi:molybdate transport system ATP-binding protein